MLTPYLTVSSFKEELYGAEAQIDDTNEETTNNIDIAMSLSSATRRRRHSNDMDASSDSEYESSVDENNEEGFSSGDDQYDNTLTDDDMMDDGRNLFAEELLGEDFECEAANIGASQISLPSRIPINFCAREPHH